MKFGRNDPHPQDSKKKIKKCCLRKPSSNSEDKEPAKALKATSKILFKPVQLFGSPPILPSAVPGKKGAVIQFAIPRLQIGKQNAKQYEQLALGCDDSVEKVYLENVSGERYKQPATYVAIAFHYVATKDRKPVIDIAETVGRLIAERFICLLSFIVGERVTAIQQQVSTVEGNGELTVVLHPESKRSEDSRTIKIPESLIGKEISEDIFKALFWLRRGLSDHDHLSAYAALMTTLEILADILLPKETTVKKCPKCGAEIGKQSRKSFKTLIIKTLGSPEELFTRLWTARNAITTHGGQTVTAEVLNEIVELKPHAILLVFQGISLAMDIPITASPKPSQIVLVTDTFLNSE